jgi:hypothetical protein
LVVVGFLYFPLREREREAKVSAFFVAEKELAVALRKENRIG